VGVLFNCEQNSLFATLIMEATEFGFELKALNPKIKGVLKVHTIASIGK